MTPQDKIAQIEQEIKDKQRELEELKKAQWPPIKGQRVFVVFGNRNIEYMYTKSTENIDLLTARLIVQTAEERDLREKWILLDADIRDWIKGRIEYGRFIRQLYGKFIEENPGASSITTNDIVNEGLTEETIRWWLDNL